MAENTSCLLLVATSFLPSTVARITSALVVAALVAYASVWRSLPAQKLARTAAYLEEIEKILHDENVRTGFLPDVHLQHALIRLRLDESTQRSNLQRLRRSSWTSYLRNLRDISSTIEPVLCRARELQNTIESKMETEKQRKYQDFLFQAGPYRRSKSATFIV